MSEVRSSDGKDNASQDSQNGTSLLWNDAVLKKKNTKRLLKVFDTWMINIPFFFQTTKLKDSHKRTKQLK